MGREDGGGGVEKIEAFLIWAPGPPNKAIKKLISIQIL